MNLYYYFFYKIYRFTKKLGNWEVAESAMYALCTLEAINLTQLLLVTGVLTRETEHYDKFLLGAICVLLIGINYYLFLRKKKYLEIEKQFKKEGKTQKLFGDVVVTIYVVFTLCFTLFLPRFL